MPVKCCFLVIKLIECGFFKIKLRKNTCIFYDLHLVSISELDLLFGIGFLIVNTKLYENSKTSK